MLQDVEHMHAWAQMGTAVSSSSLQSRVANTERHDWLKTPIGISPADLMLIIVYMQAQAGRLVILVLTPLFGHSSI